MFTMYVCKGWATKPAPAPRPSTIYCAMNVYYLMHVSNSPHNGLNISYNGKYIDENVRKIFRICCRHGGDYKEYRIGKLNCFQKSVMSKLTIICLLMSSAL
jgi:hypothetical protein